MYIYIARQPIYDALRRTMGYELLYRDSMNNCFGDTDGDLATKRIISDLVMEVGLDKLTNHLPGFVNFTRNTLFTHYVTYLPPEKVVIEILESTIVDSSLIERLKTLKECGYTFALDDYCGEESHRPLLDIVDIVKVDFQQLGRLARSQIAKDLKHKHARLLAEKVETKQDFVEAISWGYELFQGYYFARPEVCVQPRAAVTQVTYKRVLIELNKHDPSIDTIAEYIQCDSNMTYKLLRFINTLRFYRGYRIETVRQALVRLGLEEVRKWVMLLLLREVSGPRSMELVKAALIRARFCERLSYQLDLGVDDKAFLLGLLSLMDSTLNSDMDDVVSDLPVASDIKCALTGAPGVLKDMLDTSIAFENADWSAIDGFALQLEINNGDMASIYTDSLIYADQVYSALP